MGKEEKKFASRAGEKLDFAIESFKIPIKGKICADLGSSTGGFVDCLLQRGAKKIYAIEKGWGQLEWKLRNNPRVVVMEKENALFVELPEKADFISIDVGWTRQKFILPRALLLLKDEGDIVSLIKPHYEAERSELKKGKVEEKNLDVILARVKEQIKNLPLKIIKIIESPILGDKGKNKEFIFWIKKK